MNIFYLLLTQHVSCACSCLFRRRNNNQPFVNERLKVRKECFKWRWQQSEERAQWGQIYLGRAGMHGTQVWLTRQTSGRKCCRKNVRKRYKQRKIDSYGRKINGRAIRNATPSVVTATTKPHNNQLMEQSQISSYKFLNKIWWKKMYGIYTIIDKLFAHDFTQILTNALQLFLGHCNVRLPQCSHFDTISGQCNKKST